MNIHIRRDVIFQRVKMTTAYLAVKKSEPTECYDRITVTNADEEMLLLFWQDACEEANTCLRSWLLPPTADHQGEDYEVSLSLSPCVENIKGPSILTTLHSMMICSILTRWAGIADPDSENRYAEETARWRHRLARLLSFRPRPRPMVFS